MSKQCSYEGCTRGVYSDPNFPKTDKCIFHAEKKDPQEFRDTLAEQIRQLRREKASMWNFSGFVFVDIKRKNKWGDLSSNLFLKATFPVGVSFSRAIFSMKASFAGVTFSEAAEFDKARFSENARFCEATFSGNAKFGEATFSGDVWFDRATFSGYAGFKRTTFAGTTRFEGATFSGEAGFWGTTFSPDTSFERATFAGDAGFEGAIFAGDAKFERATFSQDARFDGATFSQTAWFEAATFAGKVQFNGVTFSGDARFRKVTFAGDAKFEGATFSGIAGFSRATFAGRAKFERATFSQDARFDGETFWQDQIYGHAFSGKAQFIGVIFSGDVRFEEAIFSGDAKFEGATFSGTAGFSRATFAGDAKFERVTFSDDVRFEEATFSQDVRFEGTVFREIARFSGTTFSRDARFEKAEFLGSLDLRYASFATSGNFNKCHFWGQVRVTWPGTGIRRNKEQQEVKRGTLQFSGLKKGVVGILDLRNNTVQEDSMLSFHSCDMSQILLEGTDCTTIDFYDCKWPEIRGRRVVGDEYLKWKGKHPSDAEPDMPDINKDEDDEEELDTSEHEERVEWNRLAITYQQLAKNFREHLDHPKANDFDRGIFEMRRHAAFKRGGFRGLSNYALISCYKWLSDYSGSLLRPLLWLFVSIPVFAFAYWKASFNSKIFLSFLNSLKLSVQIASLNRIGFGLLSDDPAYVDILVALQVVCTATLVALFLFAIRRRFKH